MPPTAHPREPRPGRAARAMALLAAALTVLGTVALGIAPGESIAATVAAPSAASVGQSAPARPPAQDDQGVRLDLVSLGSSALAPGDALTVEVSVTNGTGSAVAAPRLALSGPPSRVTDRAALNAWQQDTTPAAGAPVASSATGAADLAPGETRTMTVTAPADDLGYATAPELWGARRIALTLESGGTALSTLRTFVVWRPAGAPGSITESVLLPIAPEDPGLAALDPAAYDETTTTGRLAALGELAQRDDVDWLLDPVVLDPPVHEAAQEPTAQDPEPEQDQPAGDDPSADPAVPAEQGPAASPGAAALAERLAGAVGDRTVLTLPYAQADMPSVQAAGASELRGILESRSETAAQQAGFAPSASIAVVPGPQADAAGIEEAQRSGAAAILTSSASLREDPAATVTPSSAGEVATEAGTTPVLAADPVLSDELASLDGSTDAEQTSQRLLAETAVIASEPTTAPRHLLIAPPLDADLDAAATGSALDALGSAPWIRSGRTAELLEMATSGTAVQDSQDTSGAPLSLGTVTGDAVVPSARGIDGVVAHQDAAVGSEPLDPSLVSGVQADALRLEAMRSTMEDPATADDTDLTVLSAVSARWLDDPDGHLQRTGAASRAVDAFDGRVTVVPASNYTLVASGASVPITLTNDLDTPVRAHLEVSADRPLVRIPSPSTEVVIPARGRVTASVPVEAVANGQVNLSVLMTGTDGTPITAPQTVSLTVNPSWENWTTMILVVLMGLLVVIGVLRARRHGSDRRAPAILGPEDPSMLARTGLSAPRPTEPPGGRDEDPPGRADADADADAGDAAEPDDPGGPHDPDAADAPEPPDDANG